MSDQAGDQVASTSEMQRSGEQVAAQNVQRGGLLHGAERGDLASSCKEWSTMLRKDKSRTAVAMHSTKTKASSNFEKTLPVTVNPAYQRSGSAFSRDAVQRETWPISGDDRENTPQR